jgi:hypothetical protein
MGFCKCNPRSKEEERETSNRICCFHRRFVCENCVEDHPTCSIKIWNVWVKDDSFDDPAKCPVCEKAITEQSVRLPCYCVYHSACLSAHLLSNPDIPRDQLVCHSCKTLIYPGLHGKNTALRKHLWGFLQTVPFRVSPPVVSEPSQVTSAVAAGDSSQIAQLSSSDGPSLTDESDSESKVLHQRPSKSTAAPAAGHSDTEVDMAHSGLRAREVHASSTPRGDQGESTTQQGESLSINVSPAATHKPQRKPQRSIHPIGSGNQKLCTGRTLIVAFMVIAICGIATSPFLFPLFQ